MIDKFRVSPPNTYLITTRGQAGYLQLNHNFPDDWASRFRTALDASPSSSGSSPVTTPPSTR
ncbi:hypothetical protein ACFQX6_56665 [Streptosporangium lutulentum]